MSVLMVSGFPGCLASQHAAITLPLALQAEELSRNKWEKPEAVSLAWHFLLALVNSRILLGLVSEWCLSSSVCCYLLRGISQDAEHSCLPQDSLPIPTTGAF